MFIEIAKAIDANSIKVPDYINGSDANRTTNLNLDSVSFLVTNIRNIALTVASIVAVFMILYSSFLYLTSYGDESKTETAKRTLIWSIVGLLFIGIAEVIIKILESYLHVRTLT